MRMITILILWTVIFVCIATATLASSLDDGLATCYLMDDGGGATVTDSCGSNDATLQVEAEFEWSLADWKSGRSGNYNLQSIQTDATQYMETGITACRGSAAVCTFSFWLNVTTTGAISNRQGVFGDGFPGAVTYTYYFLYREDSQANRFAFVWNNGVAQWNYFSSYGKGVPKHIVMVKNGTDVEFYLNGTFAAAYAIDGVVTGDELVFFNTCPPEYCSVRSSFTQLDEIYIWNRTLTIAEIETLYNDGDGNFYPSFGEAPANTAPPQVTAWTFPVNVSADGMTNITFNWTAVVDGDGDDLNYTFWLNGTEKVTTSDTEWASGFEQPGNHSYVVAAFDGQDWGTNSTIRYFTLTYNTPPPQVTGWTFPSDVSDSDNYNITFNWTAVVDGDGDDLNYTFWLNGTEKIKTSDTGWTADFGHDGNYSYIVGTFDGQDWGTNSTIRYFTLDTQDPVLTISEPTNNTRFTIGNTIPINIVCTDENPYLLNYTFFNSSNILTSVQNMTPDGNTLGITQGINTTGYGAGTYYINASCSDSHTKGLGNLAWSYEDGTITFYKRSNPSRHIDLQYGYYNNGEVHPLTAQQIQNYNVEARIVEYRDRYAFGTRFDLPNTNFIFGFRMENLPFMDLIDEETGHFVLYKEYWLDFDLYLLKNGNPYKQTTHLIETPGHYYVYWNIDWELYNIQGGDRVTILTRSIGGLNIVQQQLSIILEGSLPPYYALAFIQRIC